MRCGMDDAGVRLSQRARLPTEVVLGACPCRDVALVARIDHDLCPHAIGLRESLGRRIPDCVGRWFPMHRLYPAVAHDDADRDGTVDECDLVVFRQHRAPHAVGDVEFPEHVRAAAEHGVVQAGSLVMVENAPGELLRGAAQRLPRSDVEAMHAIGADTADRQSRLEHDDHRTCPRGGNGCRTPSSSAAHHQHVSVDVQDVGCRGRSHAA